MRRFALDTEISGKQIIDGAVIHRFKQARLIDWLLLWLHRHLLCRLALRNRRNARTTQTLRRLRRLRRRHSGRHIRHGCLSSHRTSRFVDAEIVVEYLFNCLIVKLEQSTLPLSGRRRRWWRLWCPELRYR